MTPSPSNSYPLWARCAGCLVSILGLPMVVAATWCGAKVDWAIVVAACLISTRGLSTLTNNRTYNDGPLLTLIECLFTRRDIIDKRLGTHDPVAPNTQAKRKNS